VETGSTDRRHGNSKPKQVHTEENVTAVDKLVQSQENQPQTHHTTCQISRETGLTQSSVIQIIHRDRKCEAKLFIYSICTHDKCLLIPYYHLLSELWSVVVLTWQMIDLNVYLKTNLFSL